MTQRVAAPALWLSLGLGLSACIFKSSSSPSPAPVPVLAPATPAATPATAGAPATVAGTALDETNDVVTYAQACKQDLGIAALPVQAPWNCLSGTEIPVTIQGQPLSISNYPLLTGYKVGCDHPSWLGAVPCANYAFVQHRTLAPNVEAYLICRDQKFTSYKDRATRLADLQASPGTDSFNAYYAFDSLGMIWSNTQTGKTCFFDYVGQIYGGYVSSPEDDRVPDFTDLPDPKPPTELSTGANITQVWKKNARGTWRPPNLIVTSDNCIVCHDTGPFKSSPWMAQVMTIPPNSPTVPMLVSGAGFNPWKTEYPLHAISTAPVTVGGVSQPQICTTCHRIGSQSTCGMTASYAVGRSIPPNVPPTAALDFAHRVWMPPAPADWAGKSDAALTTLWSSLYDAHVNRLLCCCKNPAAINCTSQDMTTSPLAAPVAGTGPDVCP